MSLEVSDKSAFETGLDKFKESITLNELRFVIPPVIVEKYPYSS